MIRYAMALVVALGGTAASGQGMMPSIFKLNGTCSKLVTPDGDLTGECGAELLNMAFASGNSSFVATIKDKGAVSFRGRDSAAKGDTAAIKLDSIILTGADPSQMATVEAKGQCTYTNPNKGPIHVECKAKTAKGAYELSYVSDGVWPPR